ncbi:PH-like domain-containing protein [Cellulomonas hominis]
MPVPVSITILALLVVAALAGMWRGWRRRGTRTAPYTAALPDVPELPAAPGAWGAPRTEPLAATYVSSTRAGDWLDRVTAHDLGVRSAGTVQVLDAGVHVARVGARDVVIPAAALRAVGTSAGMAGKFVGRDRLVVLTWTTGPDDERGLDTGLHLRSADDRRTLVAAARTLIDDGPADGGQERTATAAREEES